MSDIEKSQVINISGDNDALIQEISDTIPRFGNHLNKGSAGRVAVIGGSSCYTGAPYFTSISALRTGSDLVYVFTSASASLAIKSYNPELIVYPLLEDTNFVESFSERLNSFSSLIIGPGLGRPGDVLSIEKFHQIIENVKQRQLPIVLDADSISFLSKNPDIIQGYKEAILTPNFREFKRLYGTVFGKEISKEIIEDHEIKALAERLGNVTICCKHFNDKISDGNIIVVNGTNIGPRRCGGQGDIMCGIMGTFINWTQQAYSLQQQKDQIIEQKNLSKISGKIAPTILAALAASVLTRKCAKLAFNKHYRSMLASDVIEEINPGFNSLFPNVNQWTWN